VNAKQLTRHEAIERLVRALGESEETAHLIDWTLGLYDAMDELYRRVPRALASQIIHASRAPTYEEMKAESRSGTEQQEPLMIKLECTPDEAIAIGAALTQYQMIVRRTPELQHMVEEVLPLLERMERRFLEATTEETLNERATITRKHLHDQNDRSGVGPTH